DRAREVTRALTAAVVVNHLLDDDQVRRLVVVGDRAGLRLAVGDSARTAVVASSVSTHRRLDDAVAAGVYRHVVLAVERVTILEEGRRRPAVYLEREVARCL